MCHKRETWETGESECVSMKKIPVLWYIESFSRKQFNASEKHSFKSFISLFRFIRVNSPHISHVVDTLIYFGNFIPLFIHSSKKINVNNSIFNFHSNFPPSLSPLGFFFCSVMLRFFSAWPVRLGLSVDEFSPPNANSFFPQWFCVCFLYGFRIPFCLLPLSLFQHQYHVE